MRKISKDIIYKAFSKPDVWFACIDLENDRVYGKIKGKQAILEGIPKPSTGYRYNDIVEVSDPIGTTYFRDEQISVYKAIRVIHLSNIPTFYFEAIIPTSNDYFDLMEVFKRENTHVRFPYQNNYPVECWEKGYCVVPNIKEVESIFEEYIVSGKERKVKNIIDAFDDTNSLNGEIDGSKFFLELKYPKNYINPILIILSLPIISFLVLLIKVGLHSTSEFIGFILTILFFSGLEIYSFFRLNRETITINKDGLHATYPFRKQKTLYWDSISEIRRSKKYGDVVVKNDIGLKIRVSQNYKHFGRFCIIAKKFIKPEISKNIFENE